MRCPRHEDVIRLLLLALIVGIAFTGAAVTLLRGERPRLLG